MRGPTLKRTCNGAPPGHPPVKDKSQNIRLGGDRTPINCFEDSDITVMQRTRTPPKPIAQRQSTSLIMGWPMVQIHLGLDRTEPPPPNKKFEKARGSERGFNDESQRQEREQEREKVSKNGSEQSNKEKKHDTFTATSDQRRNGSDSGKSEDKLQVNIRERVQGRQEDESLRKKVQQKIRKMEDHKRSEKKAREEGTSGSNHKSFAEQEFMREKRGFKEEKKLP